MINIKKNVIKVFKLLITGELRNIAILSSGTMLAQIIGLVAQPFATRLYSPSDFGVMAIILSLISLFSSSLNGQYHMSIVTANTDKEANAVAALALYVGLATSILVSIGIIIYTFIEPTTFADAGAWIYLTIPFLILAGITNVINSYNNRFEQYKLLTTVSIYRSISSNLVKIGLGYAKIGFIGLIISYIVSILSGLKKQSEYFLLNYRKVFSTSKKDLITLMKKYRKQPLYSAPGLFAVSYSNSIIPIFLVALYGTKELGFYALAIATIGIPFSVLTNSIGIIFFRQASKEKAELGNFYNSFKSSFVLLVLISFIPFVILSLYSESIYSIIFGSQWQRSGTFILLLMPWQLMNFIGGALAVSLIISGNQLKKLIIQSFFIVEALIIYYIAKSFQYTIEEFLISISVLYALTYIWLIVEIFKASKFQSKVFTKSSQINQV